MPKLFPTAKRSFNCSYLDEISLEGLFFRSKIPNTQKSIANNYVTIRKIFSYTVVQPKVTKMEYNKLRDNGFCCLEATSEDKMYQELNKIINWANSTDERLIELSNIIFTIRVKELKYLLANTSFAKLTELSGGYRILEKYLDFISG